MDTIFQVTKKAEEKLKFGKPIKIGKYATHDHVEKIATINAYLNSQHITGKEDSLGREKPFFNIVLAAVYTWFKTTDLDRKHIKFTPGNAKQRLKALAATIMLRKWMDKKKFGHFLNQWGWNLAAYGSAVTKFTEKEGKLIPSVIAWDRMICDPIDFYAGIRGERLYFTPDQLREQPYDQDKIEEAIAKHNEVRETIDGQKMDNKDEFIGIYEIHGKLPLYYLTGKEEDKKTYRQQMHVLFIEQNPKDRKKNFEVCLYSGKEAKDPYFISHLIEQEGRTLAIGAVEALFDPQWMVNHAMKQVKDQLDLASKLVSQTSDPDFLGRNILTDIETGSVLIHKENQPLTQVNLQSHDIPNMNAIADVWKQGAKDIAGVHEAVTGEQPPSGTPYRLQAMLSAEARGLFILMRQNKGLYLEDMLRLYILPYFQRTLKNSDEVMATLDGEELEKFDELALPANLNAQIMARLQADHIPTKDELLGAVQENNELGNVRVMKPSENQDKTWKEYFSDLDMDAIEVEITGENRDKGAILTTLDTLLQRMLSAPQLFKPEDIRKIFNKILDEVGPGIINPLQLSGLPQQGTTGGDLGGQMPRAGEVGGLGEQPIGQI